MQFASETVKKRENSEGRKGNYSSNSVVRRLGRIRIILEDIIILRNVRRDEDTSVREGWMRMELET